MRVPSGLEPGRTGMVQAGESTMKEILNLRPFCTALLFAAAVLISSTTALAQNGEHLQGKATIEPVFDSTTGNTVYAHQSLGAPMPILSNVNSMTPIYVVAYPVQSTVSTDSFLQCLPTTCDHLNVLPFPFPNYTPGSDDQCKQWNAGAPCSLVKGHVHLLGVASDGGDFTVPHYVNLVLFTGQAFADGAINQPVRTLAQAKALVDSGDAIFAPTPLTVNVSLVSRRLYEMGTPVTIPFF
jgi:hypothetical protein